MAPVSHAARPADRHHRRPGPRPPGRRRRGLAAITLLYVRPDGEAETELDRRLVQLAARYASYVELTRASAGEASRLAGWLSPGSPAVLLLRRGAVIGETMGVDLPLRELDQAVRRAVEWPATR
jgi:hypothetical protein